MRGMRHDLIQFQRFFLLVSGSAGRLSVSAKKNLALVESREVRAEPGLR
jgi:hypothetical protein